MTLRELAVCVLMIASAAIIGCSKSDDEWMIQAEQRAAHQLWNDALESYRTLLRAHPDGPRSAEALYKSAMIQYSQLKNIVGGAQTFAEVARRFPRAPEAPKSLMVLGFLYAEESGMCNLDSARRFYTQLTSLYPTNELAAGAALQLEHLGEHPNERMQSTPEPSMGAQRFRVSRDSLQHSPGARALAH